MIEPFFKHNNLKTEYKNIKIIEKLMPSLPRLELKIALRASSTPPHILSINPSGSNINVWLKRIPFHKCDLKHDQSNGQFKRRKRLQNQIVYLEPSLRKSSLNQPGVQLVLKRARRFDPWKFKLPSSTYVFLFFFLSAFRRPRPSSLVACTTLNTSSKTDQSLTFTRERFSGFFAENVRSQTTWSKAIRRKHIKGHQFCSHEQTGFARALARGLVIPFAK